MNDRIKLLRQRLEIDENPICYDSSQLYHCLVGYLAAVYNRNN